MERPWCKPGLKNAAVIIDCLVAGVLDAADVKEEVLKRQQTGEFADLVPHLKLLPNHERAGVIVSSGHHVLLKNGIVCLFIGSFHRVSSKDPHAVDCVYLPLEPYHDTVVAQPREPMRSSRRTDEAPVAPPPQKLTWSQRYNACRHPGAKLPWLKRCHASLFQVAPSSCIRFKVLVQPAFVVGVFARISNNGHLLVHDIFNYDGIRQEEKPL
jgi:hypothetical protein